MGDWRRDTGINLGRSLSRLMALKVGLPLNIMFLISLKNHGNCISCSYFKTYIK